MINNETIDISNVKLERHNAYQEMSATVDGERIWFRFPLFLDLEPRAEIFIPPAMVESMIRGIPVHIDDSIAISEKFSRNYEELQALLKSWNNDFIISPIMATKRDKFPKTENVISCYSGGIDSTYTFGKFRDEITHLLVMQGFDDWKEGKGWEKNIANRKVFADSQGKELIIVETNIRQYCESRKFDYQLLFGSVLAAVGITMNPKLFLVPSSHAFADLVPSGSHPLLEPLWRTENTEVIHHGCAATRTERTQYIAQFPELLNQLQVCWKSSASNCGGCPKCLRTSIALKILGTKSNCIPEPKGKEDYNKLIIKGVDACAYAEDLIKLCDEYNRPDNNNIKDILLHNVTTFKRKRKIHDILKFLLGNFGRKLSRNFSDNEWYKLRGTLTSNKITK